MFAGGSISVCRGGSISARGGSISAHGGSTSVCRGVVSVHGGFLRQETAREVVYVKSSTHN